MKVFEDLYRPSNGKDRVILPLDLASSSEMYPPIKYCGVGEAGKKEKCLVGAPGGEFMGISRDPKGQILTVETTRISM